MGEILDLTMPFSEKTIPVPGHPLPRFEPLTTLEQDGVRNTTMTISLHTGTHIDAPSHFVPSGASIDEIPIDRFRRPGIRLDLRAVAERSSAVSRDDLEGAGFDARDAEGAILVLASGWSDVAWESKQLYIKNPYLARDAAEAIAAARPSALALDFAVDDRKPWPNHTVLLSADVFLIENLMRLGELPPSGFEVTAFPLKLVGENGAPARVVAQL